MTMKTVTEEAPTKGFRLNFSEETGLFYVIQEQWPEPTNIVELTAEEAELLAKAILCELGA